MTQGTPKRFLAGLGVVLGLALPLTDKALAEATQPSSPPHQHWDFEGPFGQYDQKSLQRGFLIYDRICSNCHGLNNLTYNDLLGIGLSSQDIATLAHSKMLAGPPDAAGQPTQRPALPDDHFRAPFPNDAMAAAMMGGVAPPDQSRMVATHRNGPDWLYAVLTGYRIPAPPGAPAVPGKFYNTAVNGHLIGMPPPLMDGMIQYPDGTPATLPQQARDITDFLAWASDPHRNARTRIGLWCMLYLAFMLVLATAWKHRTWKRPDKPDNAETEQ